MKPTRILTFAAVSSGLLITLFSLYPWRNPSSRTDSSNFASTELNSSESLTNRSSANPSPSSSNKERVETEKKLRLGDLATVRFQDLYELLSTQSPDDLRQLAGQLKALAPGKDTTDRISAVFDAWTRLDASAALAAATSFETMEAREAALTAVVKGADASSVASLSKTISELRPDRRGDTLKHELLRIIADKWSRVDPPAAALFFETIPPNSGTNWARVDLAKNWASTDPQAALAWAKAQGVGDMSVLKNWWERDPRSAETYVRSQLGTPEGAMEATRFATMIADTDREKALTFIRSLPAVETRRSAVSTIANRMAVGDPRGAAQWAAALPSDVGGTAVPGVVGRWAAQDPQAAAEWLSSYSGPEFDRAVGYYSVNVADQDPAGALGWATGISDSQTRLKAVERVVGIWWAKNPDEARKWVQGSSLSTAEKQHLLGSSGGN